MAPGWAANRHAIVVLIALVAGAFQLLQLEQRRADRNARVDGEFTQAVALLRAHFAHHAQDGEHHIMLIHPRSPTHTAPIHALVVNRAPSIPRIEAELFVDMSLKARVPTKPPPVGVPPRARTVKPKQPRQNKQHAVKAPLLKFLIYDEEAMRPAATLLEQRELAIVVRHGPPVA